MEVLEKYERELRFNDLKEKTIREYVVLMNRFFDYLKKEFNSECIESILEIVDFGVVNDYKHHLAKTYSRNSVNKSKASLKSFFGYYSGIIGKNPMEAVRGYKDVKSKEKNVPTHEEVMKLINATQQITHGSKSVDFNAARDRFLISLLATTGLRIEEALSLTKDKLEIHDDYIMMDIDIHNNNTKNNKRVPIAGKTLGYYYEYIKEYEKKFDYKDNSFVVISYRSGDRIEDNNSNEMIRKHAKKIGITDISNHCFRDFCNIALMGNGTQDSLRNKILGWSTANDMGLTCYYRDKITEIDLLKVEAVKRILG